MITEYTHFNYNNNFLYNHNIFKNNYNIGVGTFTPNNILDIHGNVYLNNTVNIRGNLNLLKHGLDSINIITYNNISQQIKPLKLISHTNTSNTNQYNWITNYFGKHNILEISLLEMSQMHCNFFSIDKNIVISDKSFKKLNNWLRSFNIIVEEINYNEISKQGGLLRCSTLPLIRNNS